MSSSRETPQIDAAGNRFTFQQETIDRVNVFLNGANVGTIFHTSEIGWRYCPKGGKLKDAGEAFPEFAACRDSVVGPPAELPAPVLTMTNCRFVDSPAPVKEASPLKDCHADLMALARRVAGENEQDDDGVKCFNLFTFLECMEEELLEVLHASESPNGNFLLNPGEVARYLWACLACEAGGKPDGTEFKSMPILD